MTHKTNFMATPRSHSAKSAQTITDILPPARSNEIETIKRSRMKPFQPRAKNAKVYTQAEIDVLFPKRPILSPRY